MFNVEMMLHYDIVMFPKRKAQQIGLVIILKMKAIIACTHAGIPNKQMQNIRDCRRENWTIIEDKNTPPDKRACWKIYLYFSSKTYVVGTQKNRLNVTFLLSTQNKCLN